MRVFIIGDGDVRQARADDLAGYDGSATLVWVHLDANDPADVSWLHEQAALPEVAISALLATETRPRCEAMEDGALLNLRGLGTGPADDPDRLVSIRVWAQGRRVISVSRRPLAATDLVIAQAERGAIKDPGDLFAAFARAISTQLDPEVAALLDALDDSESDLQPRLIYKLRRTIAQIRVQAISFRRFVAPDRDALVALAALPCDWLADDDRLHIREAADRFARMVEELEAGRERAALLHEQLTDMRSEQIESRALLISIVALIFLPLTFVTGLLGMNVAGIPFAHKPWAFWGVTGFCVLIAAIVLAYFARVRWIGRN